MAKPDMEVKDEEKAMVPEHPRRGVVVRSPWGEFDRIFDIFRRDMDDLLGYPRMSMMAPRVRRMGTMMTPSVDMEDTGKEFVLSADMPGLSKDEVKIELDEKTLTIRAEQNVERKEEDEERCYVCQERSHRTFHRSMTLPEPIDPDKAKAEVKDGVLRLTMPKARPRKTVEVTVE